MFPGGHWYHLASVSQMRQWNGLCPSLWHDIELTSHILEVHLEISLLLLHGPVLFPYAVISPSLPLPHPSSFPVQLTVIEFGRIASCSFIQTAPSSASAPGYVAIMFRPSGIRGARVKVIPWEKTPACSHWPPTGRGARGPPQLTRGLDWTSAPSDRTRVYTGQFRLLVSLEGWMYSNVGREEKKQLRWWSQGEDLFSENKDISLRLYLGQIDLS